MFCENTVLPDGINLDENGSLQWVYNKNFFKHPEDYIPAFKFSAGTFIIISIVGLLIRAIADEVFDPFCFLIGFIIGTGLFLVIAFGLFISGLMYRKNGYPMIFILSEKSLVLTYPQKTIEQTQKLADAALIISLLAGKPGAMSGAAAVKASSRHEIYFEDVKTLVRNKKHDTILVKCTIDRIYLYASPEQYDFLWEYMKGHCKNAKIN